MAKDSIPLPYVRCPDSDWIFETKAKDNANDMMICSRGVSIQGQGHGPDDSITVVQSLTLGLLFA